MNFYSRLYRIVSIIEDQFTTQVQARLFTNVQARLTTGKDRRHPVTIAGIEHIALTSGQSGRIDPVSNDDRYVSNFLCCFFYWIYRYYAGGVVDAKL